MDTLPPSSWPPPPAASPHAPEAPAPTRWADGAGRYLLISLFWLPVSLFWGAMLGQILPARVLSFAGPAHSGTYLGIISLSGAAVGLLIQIVVGPVSDACALRWGRRRPFLFGGTTLAIGALLAFGSAGSFAGLVAAFVAIQLFLNIATGPYQALIPDHVPLNHQGAAAGYTGMMQLLGDAGGPIVAGLLLAGAKTPAGQVHAVQTIMVGVGIALLVFMLLTVLFVPDAPAPPEDRRPLAASLRETYALHIPQNPDFYKLLVSRAVYNLGFYTALGFLLYYVRFALHTGDNYSKPLVLLQEIAIGGALLGTLPSGMLADKVGKKKVIYASSLFSVVAGAAFAFAPNVAFASKMAFLFGIGFGMFRAVDWAFACNLLPAAGGAKFMGIWSLSTMVPQLLAVPLFGHLADVLNRTHGMGAGYRGAMLATLAYTLIGTALISSVREKTGSSSRASPPTDTVAAAS